MTEIYLHVLMLVRAHGGRHVWKRTRTRTRSSGEAQPDNPSAALASADGAPSRESTAGSRKSQLMHTAKPG